jgi:beta-N-acetylhexosaminidase
MRKIRLALFLGLLPLFEIGCAPERIPRLSLTPAGPPAAAWAEKMLAGMTLEEKVGQMIGWQANGRFFSRDSETIKELLHLIADKKIGGLVAFAGEVYETAHLANFLQEKARIPILIAADFEWGAAMRIDGTTLFPPFMALGAADSEELTYEMGKITAVEGRAMGIHMAYAPVVDVNINPDNPVISARSLGERPSTPTTLCRRSPPISAGSSRSSFILLPRRSRRASNP